MTAAAPTWRGRRGAMILGPTEDRVARYLADRTSNGRVTIRTVDLVAALGLERSEAYRITARLRVLGLFGIENDRGGTKGGRRYWRTPTDDGARLDAIRHRVAWSRILSWSRARRDRALARLEAIRHHTSRPGTGVGGRAEPGRLDAPATASPRAVAGGPSFAELCRRAGLGDLMDSWGV